MEKEKNIKITPSSTAKVKENDHLITLDSGTSITLEYTNTECLKDEEVKNIGWVANMFHNSPKNSKLHKALQGAKVKFKVPSVYCGGGLGWVEPVLEGKKPTFKIPYGYFINSIGTRSLDRIEWRDIHGAIIKEDKFFSEAVQLHIYTTGMYGHDIQVKLIDKNWWDYDLEIDENVKDETKSLEMFFTREVKVMKHLEDTTSKVQKVVIDVRLDHQWIHAGKVLNVIPVVSTHVKGVKTKAFKGNHIVVRMPEGDTEKCKVNPASKSGNKPVIIGDIVTDVADFKPCFFTKIRGEVMRGEEKIQDIVIYEQGKIPNQNTFTFPVVAGVQYSKAQIKLILDTDTEHCLEKEVHKGRVIDLSEIPEAVVVKSRSKVEKKRIADSSTVFSGGTVKTRNSSDENDGDNKGAHAGVEDKTNFGVAEVGFKSYTPNEVTTTIYTKKVTSDKELEIDLLYDVTNKWQSSLIIGLLSNIWHLRENKVIIYPINLKTCRKNIRVDIEVYPDIKWILQLSFNYDEEKLQKMRTKEHKKYKLQIQNLEEAYKKETSPERSRENALEEFKSRAKKRKAKLDEKWKKEDNQQRIAVLNDARTKAQKDIDKWDKKIDKIKVKQKTKEKEDKNQLKKDKKATRKAKNRKKRDNIELDDAYEDGLANFQFSLAAEFDRPYKGIDVTPNFKKIKKFLSAFLKLETYVRKFGRGDEKTKGQPQEENLDILNKIKEKLKGRSLFTFEIIPPSLAFALSWYAEHPKSGKGSKEPSMGVVWEGEFQSAPLIGVEFTFDIIALIAKAHPIMRGLAAIMSLAESLADEAEIRVDFHLEGKIELKGKGKVNTYSGRTNFNREDLAKDEDDSPFELSGEIEASLVAEIKLKQKSESWLFGDVNVNVEASGKILSGVIAKGTVKADDEGMYLEPTVFFKGIKVILHSVVFIKLGNDDDDDDGNFYSKETSKTREFVLMGAYEWGAEAIGLKKWYIT
ncbi:hypothetical protein [Tenacibaculum finnmarkense]|uniref:hypothetical protein n=2 Tax=Tenacibaculum finnmarkense TaxID=2781243 RepID=UPI001BE68400|nr:hypothetical protein [Tenacibaculum finnmarkense]MCG8859970.1 hypothetical protein [Tenacibaculum finnmarkense]